MDQTDRQTAAAPAALPALTRKQEEVLLLVPDEGQEPVRPADLARQLGVHITTVLEALRRLQALGFLKSSTAGTTRVRWHRKLPYPAYAIRERADYVPRKRQPRIAKVKADREHLPAWRKGKKPTPLPDDECVVDDRCAVFATRDTWSGVIDHPLGPNSVFSFGSHLA